MHDEPAGQRWICGCDRGRRAALRSWWRSAVRSVSDIRQYGIDDELLLHCGDGWSEWAVEPAICGEREDERHGEHPDHERYSEREQLRCSEDDVDVPGALRNGQLGGGHECDASLGVQQRDLYLHRYAGGADQLCGVVYAAKIFSKTRFVARRIRDRTIGRGQFNGIERQRQPGLQ